MTADKKSSATTSVETALESLHPIRDLAKNWDIDIAACLEEYLQDLLGDLTEEERRNLPTKAETLNFSQAALVLQNSSNVYSRKVEYLYNLVLQVHEELIANSGNKKAASANGNKRRSAADAEILEFNEYDPHVNFLLLDDVLPTDEGGSKINLQEEKDSGSARKDSGLSFATAGNTTRLSLGATLGGASRLDLSGASASHQATHNLVSQDGSLRLIDGRCDVGDDGILILPGAGGTSEGKVRRSSLFGNFSPRASVGGEKQDDSAHGPVEFDLGGDDGGGFDNDDDDHDGGGFAFADDDYGDPADPMNEDVGNPNSQPNPESQSTPKRGTTARQAKFAKKKERKEDPWALLDPQKMEESTAKSRPLKVGKTFKLPPSVVVPPSQCVTGARTKRSRKSVKNVPLSQRQSRQIGDSLALATFKAKLSSQRRSNKAGGSKGDNAVFDLPTLPLKSLAFGDEFLYIARAVAKHKSAQRRAMLKKAMNEKTEAERHQVFEDYVDEDGYGVPDFGGGDDDGVGGDDFGFGAGDDDDHADYGGNTGFGHMEDDVFAAMHGENGEHDKKGKTFQELCRAHIQKFAKGAEAYATETHLSKRVGDWHDRLAPILEEEENRPEFDIHAYTKRVVSAIHENDSYEDSEEGNPIVGFEVVTQKCPQYEVCRLFLASLMLSNSGNVRLHEQTNFNLKIQLLNDAIDRPMETYLAPSVRET